MQKLWNGSDWSEQDWERIIQTPHVKGPRNWPTKLARWIRNQNPHPNLSKWPELDFEFVEPRNDKTILYMAVGNDPNSKPRALLGQFYFPHPHHFRGDEVPWGGWRLQKQILIPPHDLWGFRKGVKQLERVWDKGLWRVKENTPVYSIKRSSPGKFTHREVRFLTNERYFLIQYWAKGKGEGMKGGRGFCWLPNQTPQVIDGLNRTLSLLEERWERFKEREDLVFVGAVD